MDGRRQGKGQYVCKQSGSKYEVKAKYSCDIKTFHGANDFQPNRANTAMIRRRDRASTAGAMVTGMRESGRRDSDMATGSMYGRIKMKSMTHDTWSLSGGNPFTLLRYLSFVESFIAIFQIQKQLKENMTFNIAPKKCIYNKHRNKHNYTLYVFLAQGI